MTPLVTLSFYLIFVLFYYVGLGWKSFLWEMRATQINKYAQISVQLIIQIGADQTSHEFICLTPGRKSERDVSPSYPGRLLQYICKFMYESKNNMEKCLSQSHMNAKWCAAFLIFIFFCIPLIATEWFPNCIWLVRYSKDHRPEYKVVVFKMVLFIHCLPLNVNYVMRTTMYVYVI